MLGSHYPAVIQQPTAQNILAHIRLKRQRLYTLQLAEGLTAIQNCSDQRSAHSRD
ncbi:hypothetical protein D3C73_1518130 [compost metagenome]